MRKWLNILFLVVLSLKTNASNFQVDTLPDYPFLQFDKNILLLPDSTSLDGFFKKLFQYETQEDNKLSVLQIGDSHVQGGYWSAAARKSFHENFGCGTKARGFVFPYSAAQSNSPDNYKITYKGIWKGCRSAFVDLNCSWGVSGFNAYSTDDSLGFQITAKAYEQEKYRFDEFSIFAEFDEVSYDITVTPAKGEVTEVSYDPVSMAYKYKLSVLNDDVSVSINRKKKGNDTIIIHGFELENELPGITYSEAGVNGGKIGSFLASQHFLNQIQYLSPDLVILSIGTNDTYSSAYSDSSFQAQYDFLLYQLRYRFPLMEFILTTPGDANRYQTEHIKETINGRKIMLALAQKYKCAVWDWYAVMGGPHSIEQWHKYELCAQDRVHLSERGYELQGKLLYNALIKRYEESTSDLRVSEIVRTNGTNWGAFWEQFYLYSDSAPLLFSSSVFWVMFLAFFLVYLLVFKHTSRRSFYLMLFSLFFYYKTGGYYFSILIFSTVLDYLVGKKIFKAEAKKNKLFWLCVSMVVNIGLLGFFKYSDFFITTLNTYVGTSFEIVNVFSWFSNEFFGSNFDIGEIILPVGISFYTFQTMSYAIDIYRGRIEPLKSMVDFGFYVCFFPQLVAGPIVRANEFIPQIHQKYNLTKAQLSKATFLILGGLVKKVIISDYIAVNFVDKVFDAPLRYSGFENLLSVYAYALQIYCDFSAYSDIAIGLALLLGFSLPDNFNAPYLSLNITDFWKRWHMSLSRWLKDYLYISLGGNRKGKIRTFINLMLTMLIGGLWHGASFRFIIWGGLHGAGLVIHKLFMGWFPKLSKSTNYFIKSMSWSLTFHFVAYCWVFFRANDMTSYREMVSQISNAVYDRTTHEWTRISHYIEVVEGYKYVIGLMILGYLMHVIPTSWEVKAKSILEKTPLIVYPIGIALFALFLFQFSELESSPFIYFQF